MIESCLEHEIGCLLEQFISIIEGQWVKNRTGWTYNLFFFDKRIHTSNGKKLITSNKMCRQL